MARLSLGDKARQVAPYVNFKVNLTKAKRGTLTPSERRKINETHRLLYGYEYKDEHKQRHYQAGLATGLKYPVPLSAIPKRDREAILEAAGQPRNKHIKAVFLDTVQGKSGKLLKPKIARNRKGEIYYEVNHVRRGFVPLNPRAMVKDPGREIDKALSIHPDTKAWLIKCGEAESRNQESRSTVKEKVINWMGQYRNWKKWLVGLVPMEFTKQKAFRHYRKDRDETLKKNKANKAKLTRDAEKAKRNKGRKRGKK